MEDDFWGDRTGGFHLGGKTFDVSVPWAKLAGHITNDAVRSFASE